MRNGAIALTCVALLAFAAQATSEPATWITRDVELDLKDLPKTYSCNDLWYKLRGILLAIGARQYMAITPYHCGHGAADDGRSPTLDLKFQTLRALTPAQARWADTEALTQIVRLGPGEPKILDSDDCALLEQIQGTVFAYLNMQVVAKNFECAAASTAHHFGLSVRVLMQKPGRAPPT